jgi:hypothetical protein
MLIVCLAALMLVCAVAQLGVPLLQSLPEPHCVDFYLRLPCRSALRAGRALRRSQNGIHAGQTAN